jgi:hypothetical protein
MYSSFRQQWQTNKNSKVAFISNPNPKQVRFATERADLRGRLGDREKASCTFIFILLFPFTVQFFTN